MNTTNLTGKPSRLAAGAAALFLATTLPGLATVVGPYNPVRSFDQPEAFKVVVSNDSGSQTSPVATLTVVNENQPIVASTVAVSGFAGAPVRLPLSKVVQSASDPDGDAIFFSSVDPTGSHPTSPGQITLEGAIIVYMNNAVGFLGEDQFNVMLVDSGGATTPVRVTVQLDPLNLNIGPAASGSVRVFWPATATVQGFRLLSGETIDAVLTPITTGITTTGTESFLETSTSGSAQFFRLTYP